jgi:hypothetical protein
MCGRCAAPHVCNGFGSLELLEDVDALFEAAEDAGCQMLADLVAEVLDAHLLFSKLGPQVFD